MGLSDEQIAKLLAPKAKPASSKLRPPCTKHLAPRTEQKGPLRWYNSPRICIADRGCKSSTYLTVDGKPACMMHALRLLNDIILEMTEHRRKELGHDSIAHNVVTVGGDS